MNRLYLIAGVLILIVALVFLSQGIKKASPTDEDLQQQAQQEAQKEQQQKTPPAPSAPTKPSLAASSVLPAEETVGNPAAAQHHIQVGWVYDEADQKSPELLTGPLGAIREYVNRSGGKVSAEIADLDVPAEDRSPAAQAVTDLGVSLDGNPVLPGSFSERPVPAGEISKALDAAVGKK